MNKKIIELKRFFWIICIKLEKEIFYSSTNFVFFFVIEVKIRKRDREWEGKCVYVYMEIVNSTETNRNMLSLFPCLNI